MRILLLFGLASGAITAVALTSAGCETASCADYNDPACIGAVGPEASTDSARDAEARPDVANGDGDANSHADGSAEASSPDAADAADTNPPCPANGSPKDNACLVDEAYGLFVAPSGSDVIGDGTKGNPYATISAAAPKAVAANKPRVFTCAGTWGYAASLDATSDGVKIYGGFACGTWSYGSANKVLYQPNPGEGPALRIGELTKGITIEDVTFVTTDGVAPGESSIAALVHDSQNVVLRRVTLTAGAGVTGSAGATPNAALPTPTKGSNADDPPGANGGGAVTCLCANGTSIGGQGGAGATDGANGSPSLSTNKGTNTGATSCTNASKGADATPPADGTGAGDLGTIVGSAWTPKAGTKGPMGGPGQGGGGGGSIVGPGNGGGGGGCGGCGGDGGGGGGGGGASIALLAIASSVAVETSTLTSAKAGAGGAGAAGQPGGAGAAKGNASSLGSGCNGGLGGAGAQGGAGGGGAGGVSAAVAWKGTMPTVDGATTSTVGGAGAKGVGGKPGSNDGVVGASGALVALP